MAYFTFAQISVAEAVSGENSAPANKSYDSTSTEYQKDLTARVDMHLRSMDFNTLDVSNSIMCRLERLREEMKLNDSDISTIQKFHLGPWKKYTDDLVSFSVPDHPLLEVQKGELVLAEDPFGLYQEDSDLDDRGWGYYYSCSNHEKLEPSETYYIVYGGRHVLAEVVYSKGFSLYENDGFCCGGIWRQVYLFADHQLKVYGIHSSAAQLRGFMSFNDEARLSIKAFVYGLLPYESYRQLGMSLNLQQPSQREESSWRKFLVEEVGHKHRLGWFRPEMTLADLKSVFGDKYELRGNEVVFPPYDPMSTISPDEIEYSSYKFELRDGKLFKINQPRMWTW